MNPNNFHAQTQLGIALAGLGRLDEAIVAFRRAIQIAPESPEAHNNLGNALRERGRFDEAVAACRRALELKPDFAEALVNLGASVAAQGQLEQAIAAYRRALEIKPDLPHAHNNLASALRESGRFDEAIAACRRALDLDPRFPEAHNNLGASLAELGQLDEAIAAYQRALQIRPDFPETLNNLGDALRQRDQLGEAIAACRRALHLKPSFPEAENNLGNALRDKGDLDEAMAAFRRALHIKPGYAAAHNNLGDALRDQGHLDEAIAEYRRALDLKPDFADAHFHLGLALTDQGQIGEAIAAFRRAVELKPRHAGMRSQLIFALHLQPSPANAEIFEEHQRWNRQFNDPLQPYLRPHANDPNPERRLRVGYVSSDFRDHPVGRYLRPLLERHDREQFEILCYSGTARPDRMTERLRALAKGWRETQGVPDARLAEMIREDQIDILVDLSLHTAGNRLPVFARQPAPVQVAWLGYPGSTGLPGIGYRLTDSLMEPPGNESAWSSEERVRLPGCWCCYQPPDECPEIHPLPALAAQGVTFGSLNNFAKIHEGVLARWARVLEAVKGSRLLMRCPAGQARERVRAFFGARGIAPERVEMIGIVSRSEYLQLYQRIDLALDPFPYNGMTTTCDALWMGAPVLTVPGATPSSRAGLSLLSSIGLAQFAPSSEEDGVRLAAELAADLPRLAELRATMRPRMLASPLMDAPRFAQIVEGAYRELWQRWCKDPSPLSD